MCAARNICMGARPCPGYDGGCHTNQNAREGGHERTTNTTSQHTAHTQTHYTRRNTSGQRRRPAGRRADDHQRNARPRRLRSF